MAWAGLRKKALAGEYVYEMMIVRPGSGNSCHFCGRSAMISFHDMEHGNYSMETVGI